MTKSAKGDADNPGSMVKQKSGLNRAILNQGWGYFKTFLQYKQVWNGGQVVFVDPKNTSQECPQCHCISKDNRQTQSEFECIQCHHQEHADVVGAKNILSRGIQKLRDEGQDMGDGSPRWLKQVLQNTARFACEVSDVVMSPAAGTRQLSDELKPDLV